MDRSPAPWYPLDNGETYHWVFPPSTGKQKQILHPKCCEGQRTGRHNVQINLFVNITASLPQSVTTKTHPFCPIYTYPELTVCVNVVFFSDVDPFVRGNEPLLKSQARVFARYSNNKGQNLLICFPLPSHPSHCEKTSNIYKAVLWGSGGGSRCCKTKLGIQIFSYNSHQFSFIILFSPTDCRELCSVQSFTCSQRQRQI